LADYVKENLLPGHLQPLFSGVGTKYANYQNEKRLLPMSEKKIVFVDDDESIRKTFFLMFKKDYRVYLAEDSDQALREFKNLRFDLIVADYRLPHLNGLEMIGRFRELGYKGDAILISAYADLIKIEDLDRYAVGHFFVKPLDFHVLTRSIEYLLQPREVA
jgi:DNA-binding NtrC family response regulator